MEKDRKKKIIALLLIAVISTLSVAFAAMSRTLNIKGTAKMDTATWDVHFENLSDARIIRDALEVNKPYISDDGIMIYDMNVKLTKPKDEIIYTVEIVNSGTIDAEIESIEVPTLTEEQEKLIDFTAVYNNGTSITEKDFLKAGEEDLITISIKYSNDITEFDLPDEALTINLTFKINYIQSDSLTNENSGKTEVVSLLTTQGYTEATGKFYRGPIAKNTVESIDFLSTMYVPNDALGSWDASQYKNGSVVAWYQDVNKNGLYELYIGGNGKVIAPTDCAHLFQNFNKLKTINFNCNFDTSNTTKMNEMFYGSALTTLDLSSFDTSKVTAMDSMFYACWSLENLDVSTFNTENVTSMEWMFRGCEKLTNIDVSSWNTTNLINMRGIFHACTKLESVDFSKWDTSNVTNMNAIFYCCYSLTSIDLSNFNTSNVTDMSAMFSAMYGGSSMKLTSINLSSFNTEKVTNMSYMFAKCSALTNIDLDTFDTSKVTNMESMFRECSSLLEIDVSNFDTSNVTTMGTMFHSCQSLTSLDLSSFNTSKVTIMGGMLAYCSNLKNIDLSSWDISNVTNMKDFTYYTFATLDEFKFNKFNPKSVTNGNYMFGWLKINVLDVSEVPIDTYSNTYFTTLLSKVVSGGTVYVLNEECVTLGQSINPNVNFVVKEV